MTTFGKFCYAIGVVLAIGVGATQLTSIAQTDNRSNATP
jgi:hypothetical protein